MNQLELDARCEEGGQGLGFKSPPPGNMMRYECFVPTRRLSNTQVLGPLGDVGPNLDK